MENILVVKLSAIGDVIHALPVSYAIKEQYPEAHLTWVVEQAAYAILADNPCIDELILFEKAKFRSIGGFLREIGPFRRRLRTRRYDASLDLQGLFKSAAIAWNAGAKLRIGTANMREGAHLVSRPVRGAHAEGHIVERYLDVARALGCRVGEVRFPVSVSDRDRMAADTLLAREGVQEGRPFVAFAVGANWPNKRWPVEYFAALADRLHHAHYVPVLVGGGRLDATLAEDILRASEIPPVNLVGRTNLKQLAHVFTRAALVLGGDTGPVHLAAGLRVPTVMLMGPTDANRNGPYGQLQNAIEVDRPCRGCWKRACPKGLDCLAAISVDAVAAQIGAVLRSVRR
ncbi:lipopolysaccharide heptosyltransferase II [Selenomonas dianae]|uniref:lipopolysaccharide heptosyltransferase II n=1 Tax=Selenomonas dianae TaxID=135079 RepID=A0ABN0T5T0_9FIRM|nr:lipopolysaccharide heptosyltransferase II [Selenomonas dianae]WLD82569.1 lipopolysaccharide heptosyltransferase II [Selenomonas dianae]